jgi:uncharacterized protein YyaL (SSP411 family)
LSEKTTEQPVGSAPNIPWRSSLGGAREEARQSGKLVFVYLWHHFCGGSKTMGERTYPDETARSYLERHFVPVRFNTIEDPSVPADFGSGWTPTLIVEDAEGREHRRSQGYLDPERFVGELSLARVKDAVDRHDYEAARERAGEALKKTAGDPWREPEVLYWKAVADFEVSEDRDDLTGGWEPLMERFPGSEWAKKASYVRE